MPNMTPVRVRGKRTATKAEKWHSGKTRMYVRQPSTAASDGGFRERSAPSQAKAAAKRSRKRRDGSTSRLEQLPTEMLQSIFEYSANVDLPLASSRLAAQLASRVLYHQLTSQVLHNVLNAPVTDQGGAAITTAMRLMNSRFFTWPFFKSWLHGKFERLQLRSEWEEAVGQRADSSDGIQRQEEWTWYRLHPSSALPPPTKLLCRPFSDDKVQFLKFMIAYFREEPETLGLAYRERVQDGLQQAVEDGADDALNAFFSLGAQVDTELLRKAVIDAGCNKGVVQRLITRTTHLTSEPSDVDFLDPALWAWADKARSKGDDKGSWLLDQLKGAARDSGQVDGGIKQT